MTIPFWEQIDILTLRYPHIPKWLVGVLAVIVTITGWTVTMFIVVVGTVALEMITEFLVAKDKYEVLKYHAFSRRTGLKLAGYISLSLLATALSWLGVEVKDALNVGVPEWIFLLTPNGVGIWIFFASALVTLNNVSRLGVPLPLVVVRGLKLMEKEGSAH